MRKIKITVNGISGLWKKYCLDLFAAFVLAFTLFLLYPIGVYQKNIGAVDFNLGDIWYLLFSLVLVAFVVSAVLGVLIHKILYKYIAATYLSIILGFWVQGNLLTYDLGKLDGHVIDWGTLSNYYVVEIVVWAGVIAAAVWFRKIIYKNLSALLVVLLMFEAIPIMIIGFVQSSSHKPNENLYFNYEREFEFSSDKNVVIIILDGTQEGAFQQILARTPAYRDAFKDFIFFNNALGGYPTTAPSIPLILSGEYNDNSIPFKKFLEDTQKNSLPALLKANGYAVEYYSIAPFAYQSIWDNASTLPLRTDLLKSTNKLYLVTFLRYLPLPFKPLIMDQYYKGRNYSGQDMADLYNNAVMTSKADKGPVFKFIHLTGAHPPFTLDASLQLTPDGNYLDQLEGGLLTVDRLLQEMRAAGVYDNSLILIMADHGAAWDVFVGQNEIHQPLSIEMRYGTPLLMAKGFHQEQDELAISNAPVSLADISKTVMEVLNLDNKHPGLSLFADIPENRSRIFYYYQSNTLDWNSDFLPPLYKFEVNGNVYDLHSWRFAGKQYAGSGQLNLINYQYGEDMISNGNLYIDLFSIGFSGAWATGPYSCLYLPVEKSGKSLLSLSLSMSPFLEKEHLREQKMNILADNQLIKSFQLQSSTSMAIPLPANLTSDKKLNLCFEFPDAKYSPKDLGINNDARYLGGLFQSIIVNEIDSYSLPAEFNFGEMGNANTIKGTGWWNSEPEFTWTDGQNAQLFLPLIPGDTENIKLVISAIPFLNGEELGQQLVIIRSQGVEIGRWTMDHDGEYTVVVPSKYINDQLLNIEFEMPNAFSPASLGPGQDDRLLGMAVRWIRANEIISYSLPAEFNFGEDGNAAAFRSAGWLNSEPEFTWTNGKNAQLHLPLISGGAENIKLTISAMPFIGGEGLSQQLVIVRSNGVELGRWTMDHDGEYAVMIHSEYLKNELLNIEFEIPNAASPASLGLSQDSRLLGMAVRWIRVEK